jgi:hypothetical protein
MTRPNIQIDDLVREMTEEEFTTYQAEQELKLDAKAELEAKQAARTSGLAKLASLGLTEEEIAAL